MPTIHILLLLTLLIPPTKYRAADGTWVRKPHIYKRHPNAGTVFSGTCQDGAVTFSHNRQGACSHHTGLATWHGVPVP